MKTSKRIGISTIFSAAVVLCAVQAQDVDDYRGASAMAKREGCTTASIPYPDLRDAAERKQTDVTRWCKDAARSCTGLETKSLIATINGIPRDIENLKRERDSLRDKRSSAPESERSSMDSKISDLDKKIDERDKELEFNKKSLDTDRSDAEKRIYNGDYCVQARKDVQAPFRSANSRARDAGNADSAIKVFTDELRNTWDRCEQEHEKDVRAAQDAIDYCKSVRSGDR